MRMFVNSDAGKKFSVFLPYLVLIIIGMVVPLFPFLSTRFWLNVFVVVFVKCIGAVGLRTLSLSGTRSFAHGAFVGIGAYTAALLANHLGVPAFLTIPAGAILATILGVLTGFPFVRLRSVYYIMASMFLGISIVYVFSALKITGGTNGITYIPGFFKSMKVYYYFFLALTVVSCAIMYRFEFSRIGVTLNALSQSPEAAAAMGVNGTYFRLMAVGVGCFFAGLSGAAFAHYNASLSPNSFGLLSTFWFMMYITVGGYRKFIGPILGSIILVIIPQAARTMGAWAPLVTAVAMLLIAYLLPGGLASIPETIKDAVNIWREQRETALHGKERGE